METSNVKKWSIGIGVFVLLIMIMMWSLNTLTDLFGLPHAQFRHLVAIVIIIMSLKWIFSSGRPFHRFRKTLGIE
jgi:MFS-type transporter involved in bile tolerance (Atg22 family)